MKQIYKKWIDSIYTTQESSLGKCNESTLNMCSLFTELKRVRGWYYCDVWGERTHWWCIDEENNIVDPTYRQFPSKGAGIYVEWDDEVDKEPIDKCMNCGKYCYDNLFYCSEKCRIILDHKYNKGY